MLASSAPDLAAALAKAGGGEVAVDAKLDGIRIQVHRTGDDVLVATRSLEDITARLPEVVDGGAVAAGRRRSCSTARRSRSPRTAGRGRSRRPRRAPRWTAGVVVTPYFFDVLHLDGADLLDCPGVRARRGAGAAGAGRAPGAAPGDRRRRRGRGVPRRRRSAPATRASSSSRSPRRTTPAAAAPSWVKVKPVHTLDLVVLAVEWGSGRRQGWLSNIHLGARDPAPASFVMLGKTFKGMTDEMLAWQTERFTGARGSTDDGWVVDGPARAGRRDRVRRRAAVHALPRRRRAALRPGGPLPRRQAGRRDRHDRDRCEAFDLQTCRLRSAPRSSKRSRRKLDESVATHPYRLTVARHDAP